MKIRGDLENRIFITFFVIVFVLILLMTLAEWMVITHLINQHEDREINSRIARIESVLSNFTSERTNLVVNLANNPVLARAIADQNNRQIADVLSEGSRNFQGLFAIYDLIDNQLFDLYGERIVPLENNLQAIFNQGINPPGEFFVSMGGSSYFVAFDYLETDIPVDTAALIFYLEEFSLRHLGISFDFDYYQIPRFEDIGFLPLPSTFQDSESDIKRALARSTENQIESTISRLSIDSAMGQLIRYDLQKTPNLIILIPFDRDFNAFAHRGLLIFVLLLMAMALLMIAISGAWFSRQVLSPIKNISNKMHEIEQNPSSLEPLPKKYHGVLGKMINTFNSMNKSLSRYSQSLLDYKTIINNLDSGILWMDENFDIILCNPSILKIFKLEAFQDIIGKNLNDFVNLSDRSFEKARNKELFIPHLEINHPQEKKIIKFVLFNLRAVDDYSGLRFVASITDITKESKEARARERLELELIKSNKLADLGRLVEGIVHNLNSPLNTIVGYAQLIKKDHPENGDADKIISSGRNIAKIIKQLMLKVREDSISMMRLIDINDVVTQELDMCRHNIFFAQHINLITDLKPIRQKINAAHGEISLCIANLLNNAIQAMEKSEKKELTVKTDLDRQMITVEISDTGFGIRDEDLQKIFTPEYSTKKTSTGEGFGLGLPMTKSIIEKYKGYVTVQSTIGVGTTFTIFIPWYGEERTESE